MADKAAAGPPLDETWWSQPIAPGDLHNNSILFYFADSPFFDKTSNNWIVYQQSLTKPQHEALDLDPRRF